MTIRDKVNLILNEIASKRDMMTPLIASDKLMELTVYHSSLTSKIAEANHNYNVKLAETLKDDLPVSKAEIISKASEEYRTLDEYIRFQKSLEECIRSLKIFIRSMQDDYNLTK